MSRMIEAHPTSYTEQMTTLQKAPAGKLIFIHYNGALCALLVRNQRLLAMEVLPKQGSFLGGIYVGRIKNVVTNLNACFVEIKKGVVGFLPLAQAKSAFLCNRDFDGRFLQGDEILVKVIKDAQKGKDVALTAQMSALDLNEDALHKAKMRPALTCLKEPDSPYLAILERLADPEEYDEIVTDHRAVFEALSALEGQKPLRFYQDSMISLDILYGLRTKIEEALNKRVWLKSGAFLIIEPTEALTVIDVNSGKFTPSKQTKADAETFYGKVNEEAAVEIALQLRLRNLSGMILVDFINLKEKEARSQLLDFCKNTLEKDPRTRVVDITRLGLLEMTRKKIGKPLAEQVEEGR